MNHIASNLDPVREIRLAQFTPKTSRVVIDMRQAARYQHQYHGQHGDHRFRAACVDQCAGSCGAEQSNLTHHQGESSAASRNEQQAKQGQVPAPAVALPAGHDAEFFGAGGTVACAAAAQDDAVAAGKRDGSGSVGIGQSRSPRPKPPLRLRLRQLPHRPRPRSRLLYQRGQLASQTLPPVAVASGRYSGEPISVNLKEVDLRDFFRLIHEISGLNVVVDPSVKGL